ncbi:flippase [Patescibacteria group bacterium]
MFKNIFGINKLKIASNTISQIVAKAISAGATFVISIIIAKEYGASGYGDFTKIITFVAFFYLLADFGLNAIYLQLEDEKDLSWWHSLIAIRIVLSFILIFTLLAIVSFLPSNGENGYTYLVKLGIILFSPTILFQAMITTSNVIFQKKFRYEFLTASVLCGSIISLVLVYISSKLFVYNAAIVFIVISLAIGALASTILSLYFSGKFRKLGFFWNFHKIKKIFIRSIPFGLTLVLNVIYFRIDTFILTITRSTAEVGIYGLAYKIFEFPLVFPTFFMNAVYPLMVNEFTKKENSFLKLKSIVKKSSVFLATTSFLATTIVWMVAPYVTLIKADFYPSITALRILSLGLPLFFLSSLAMWTMIVANKRISLFLIYAISMSMNIIANIMFIPKHGFIAASWITVVTELIVLILSILVIMQFFKQENEKLERKNKHYERK